MENTNEVHKPMNSKGAAIFKVMLDDKRAIHDHLQKGGEMADILKEIRRNHEAISVYLKNGGKLEDFQKKISN
jgi:hypothetical protein